MIFGVVALVEVEPKHLSDFISISAPHQKRRDFFSDKLKNKDVESIDDLVSPDLHLKTHGSFIRVRRQADDEENGNGEHKSAFFQNEPDAEPTEADFSPADFQKFNRDEGAEEEQDGDQAREETVDDVPLNSKEQAEDAPEAEENEEKEKEEEKEEEPQVEETEKSTDESSESPKTFGDYVPIKP